MSGKTRVLIADDHAIIRQGIKLILSHAPDMEVTGEADCSTRTLQLLRESPFDVVLLDISLPDRSGIDTLKLVRKEFPKLPVLMLSMHPEELYAIRALRAGAAGYLSKQGAPEQVVTAIRQVASGRKFVSAAVAEELASAISEDASRPLHEKLSDREYQTLCLIASGHTLTQIGEELNLSVKTVSVYRARLLEKMKLRNNAELTHYGLKHGLVE
ncbi:MAG: response regulator transcription factor [Candidatus Dactylopiibacterium sp.]|nr:response regulator transcription factor [Candidatus Dactylopiibacterium sp.]